MGFVPDARDLFNGRGVQYVDKLRLLKTFSSCIVSIRLVMFQTYFLVCIAGSDRPKQEIAQR